MRLSECLLMVIGSALAGILAGVAIFYLAFIAMIAVGIPVSWFSESAALAMQAMWQAHMGHTMIATWIMGSIGVFSVFFQEAKFNFREELTRVLKLVAASLVLVPAAVAFGIAMLLAWFILLHIGVFPFHLGLHLFGVTDFAQRSLGHFWNWNNLLMWFGIFSAGFIVIRISFLAHQDRFADQIVY